MFYVPGAEAPLPLEVAISLKDITEVMSLWPLEGAVDISVLGSQPRVTQERALDRCLDVDLIRTEVRVDC